ncbi:hypothetical protein BT69DRAFT_1315083 [Atractiella rhizophila]|nr:hypothetical protein BT69DRAFT_1315083 [Atractiella rhizophila]
MDFADEEPTHSLDDFSESPQEAHRSLAILSVSLGTVVPAIATGMFVALRQDKTTIACFVFAFALVILLYGLFEGILALFSLNATAERTPEDDVAVYEPLRTVESPNSPRDRGVEGQERESPPGYEDAIDPSKQIPLPPIDPSADVELQLSSSPYTATSIFPLPPHLRRTWKAIGCGLTLLFLDAPFLMIDAESFPDDSGFKLAWIGVFWFAPLSGWAAYFSKLKQMRTMGA